MNTFKTLAMVGLMGVGVVYGQTPETNKIVEIKTQILAFPKDTEISDKLLQDVLRDNNDVSFIVCPAILMKEDTQSLLQSLKNQQNVDTSDLPVIKVSSAQTGTASNVLECKIPDTDETKIGITITATPIVQKDTSIALDIKVDWNRYFGYYSKNNEGKWTFNIKNPNAVAVIPSIRPTIPLIRHSVIDIKTTIYDGSTAVYQFPVLDELKTTKGDQITLLLVTVNLKMDETQIRKELSEQLEKTITTKDKAGFEDCFGYRDLKPTAQNSVKLLEKKVFEWDKAYVEIVDPILLNQLNPKDSSSGNTILTFEKGNVEMNGKYLFDVHITKEKSTKNGFIIGGGISKGKTIVLSNIDMPHKPSPTPQ